MNEILILYKSLSCTNMGWIWIIIIIQLLVLALLSWFWPLRNKNKKLPPGPKGFPIFGSLHLLGKLPYRDLQRLSLTYGPIMHMKLGVINTIVVSSSEVAELFLKTHDHIFASRPVNVAFNYLTNGQPDLLFAEYGPYWRNMRKMCSLELLSKQKVKSFQSLRREELGMLIDNLREATRNGVVVDISSQIFSLNANVTRLMIFGRKCIGNDKLDESDFKMLVKETLKLGTSLNFADFIPYIRPLDLQGLNRRAKSVGKVIHTFLDRIIDESLETKKDTKCFINTMLDLMNSEENIYQINRSNIKAIVLDMILAAIDTSAATVDWALSELIKHPHVMKKLQEELENVVGLNRLVEESDLDHMKYLDMIVKETLRLHPPGPLLAPRESSEECIVNNLHIPNKSRIIVNAWAIGRDPSVWFDAEKFFPERFIDSEVDMKGRGFQMIPFGSGRRICPGMLMGLNMVNLVLAQLVHCFDFKLPNDILPSELDMEEEFSLSSGRAKHLMVTLVYRLIS